MLTHVFFGFLALGLLTLNVSCGPLESGETSGLQIYKGKKEDHKSFETTAWYVTDEAYQCSGVLIAKNFFLTAGHCLEGAAREIYVKFETDRKPNFAFGKKYVVKGKSPKEDMGILKLDHDLPLKDEEIYALTVSAPARGTKAVVIGYGENEESGGTPGVDEKRSGEMVFQGYYQSGQAKGTLVFAPGSLGQMPCIGDSGGPVLVEGPNGKKAIAALVQGAVGMIGPPRCGRASTNLFVPIVENRDWITQKMQELQ